MLWLFYFAVFAFANCFPEREEEFRHPICAIEGYVVCDSRNVTGKFENRGTLLPNADFLNKNCESIMRLFNCLADYEDVCRKLEPIVKEHFKGITDTIVSICNPESDLGKAYRENVDCANGLKNEFISCGELDYRERREFVQFLKGEMDLEEDDFYDSINFASIQCLFDSLLWGCTTEVILDKCGKEALQVATEMNNKLGMVEITDCKESKLSTFEYGEHFEKYLSQTGKEELSELVKKFLI